MKKEDEEEGEKQGRENHEVEEESILIPLTRAKPMFVYSSHLISKFKTYFSCPI